MWGEGEYECAVLGLGSRVGVRVCFWVIFRGREGLWFVFVFCFKVRERETLRFRTMVKFG